jgi:hypothetical protein
MTTLLTFLSSLLPSFIQKRDEERQPDELSSFDIALVRLSDDEWGDLPAPNCFSGEELARMQ